MGLDAYAGMKEIIEERDYARKVYDAGDGTHKILLFTSHHHYKDERGDFQEIDQRLKFDEISRSWKHTSASYHPELPEYSDGLFGFRTKYEGADFTVMFRPITEHVLGKYLEDVDGSASVLYPDAFGKGMDLQAYSYSAGVKKVICVKEAPADLLTDLTFDFEIVKTSIEDKEIVKSDGSVFADYKEAVPVLSAITLKPAELDFTDKTIRIGELGKYIYFRNAMMWDSAGRTLKVPIKLVSDTDKIVIRKIIPRDFIDRAIKDNTFPIFTDHPTSYYAGAGDGTVYYSSNDLAWVNVHPLTAGEAATTNNITPRVDNSSG